MWSSLSKESDSCKNDEDGSHQKKFKYACWSWNFSWNIMVWLTYQHKFSFNFIAPIVQNQNFCWIFSVLIKSGLTQLSARHFSHAQCNIIPHLHHAKMTLEFTWTTVISQRLKMRRQYYDLMFFKKRIKFSLPNNQYA